MNTERNYTTNQTTLSATRDPANNTHPPGGRPTSSHLALELPDLAPWPEPVDGKLLLAEMARVLSRLVVLPKWAAETLALWTLHTFAFHLRDVTTYIGLESPEKRCGKTTLLSVLNELANRAVASSNISPPAFFRVIEELSPTLLIDEVDTFLSGNDQLKGILNSGYSRKTAFVLRAVPAPNEELDAADSVSPGAVKRYSCWCPKIMARIGRFPDTLADRCIVIRMQRKTSKEECERSRQLDATPLKRQCIRFVSDHAAAIAAARPQIPPELNDRAADIWEPLLALADLAGGEWPRLAREAAVGLSAAVPDSNPITALLFDIFMLFTIEKADRMSTHSLVEGLDSLGNRPWMELRKQKETTDLWLAQKLRPYGIKSKNLRIGDKVLKGYLYDELIEVFRRYISRSELHAMLAEHAEPPANDTRPPPSTNGEAPQSSAP